MVRETVIMFIVGLVTGGFFGVLMMALMVAARFGDEMWEPLQEGLIEEESRAAVPTFPESGVSGDGR